MNLAKIGPRLKKTQLDGHLLHLCVNHSLSSSLLLLRRSFNNDGWRRQDKTMSGETLLLEQCSSPIDIQSCQIVDSR